MTIFSDKRFWIAIDQYKATPISHPQFPAKLLIKLKFQVTCNVLYANNFSKMLWLHHAVVSAIVMNVCVISRNLFLYFIFNVLKPFDLMLISSRCILLFHKFPLTNLVQDALCLKHIQGLICPSRLLYMPITILNDVFLPC